MALQSLLLTNDQDVEHPLRSSLHDLGIGVEFCATAAAACEIMVHNHFDVVILDWQTPGCGDVLATLRGTASNRGALVFLIEAAAGSTESAAAGPVDYVLSRPLSLEQTWRTLRSARQRMEYGMLRYFRVHVESLVALFRKAGPQIQAETRNVGRGGIALQSPVRLQVGEELGMELWLPGCPVVIEARSAVVWTDEKGLAGLRFVSVPPECRSALESWIGKRLGEREFAFVFNSQRRSPEVFSRALEKGLLPTR